MVEVGFYTIVWVIYGLPEGGAYAVLSLDIKYSAKSLKILLYLSFGWANNELSAVFLSP